MRWKKKKKKAYGKISFDADSALIDSKNLGSFDADKFEGVIEKPLDKKNFIAMLVVVVIIIIFFLWKTFSYQITNGETYVQKALANFTREAVIFSERGVVFDRNGVELIWNEKNTENDFPKRAYISKPGFAHILGFLSYPQTDTSGNYFEKEYVGKGGVEKYFNQQLNGKLGAKIVEVNSTGKIVSDNIINRSEPGENISLSIDAFVQNTMAVALQNYLDQENFIGGAAAMMNVQTGEILAMVSLPEYSSAIMTDGTDRNTIKDYIFDEAKPFLNKAVYGEFTPGSIIKPFVALQALEENIITAEKKIYTNGRLVLPNRYNPSNPTIFRDWQNHGVVDLKKAIARSSNVYFYILGGGFQDASGLGIAKLEKNYRLFGFGEHTGIQAFDEKPGLVPNMEWKKTAFADARPWSIGNTYHTSIGQFGFLTTPIQALIATAAIASKGTLWEPTMIKDTIGQVKRTIVFAEQNWNSVHEAMHETTQTGTAQTLKFDFIDIAAKTGTAQIKANTRENSWTVGFFPYDTAGEVQPKYAFVFLAEDGPKTTTRGVSNAAREMFLEISQDKRAAKEYLNLEIEGGIEDAEE